MLAAVCVVAAACIVGVASITQEVFPYEETNDCMVNIVCNPDENLNVRDALGILPKEERDDIVEIAFGVFGWRPSLEDESWQVDLINICEKSLQEFKKNNNIFFEKVMAYFAENCMIPDTEALEICRAFEKFFDKLLALVAVNVVKGNCEETKHFKKAPSIPGLG